MEVLDEVLADKAGQDGARKLDIRWEKSPLLVKPDGRAAIHVVLEGDKGGFVGKILGIVKWNSAREGLLIGRKESSIGGVHVICARSLVWVVLKIEKTVSSTRLGRAEGIVVGWWKVDSMAQKNSSM